MFTIFGIRETIRTAGRVASSGAVGASVGRDKTDAHVEQITDSHLMIWIFQGRSVWSISLTRPGGSRAIGIN